MAERYVIGTLTADGAITFDVPDVPRDGSPPIGRLDVFGDFGGGTISIDYSPDKGGNYIDILTVSGDPLEFTENGSSNIEMVSTNANKARLRLTLAGSTNPNISALFWI